MEREDEKLAAVRFKSRGRYPGTREVRPFGGDDWKAWLEFQLEINRLYTFLGLDRGIESMRYLQKIISQLLVGRDLNLFNQRWSGELTMEAITMAMDAVAQRYCPLGTIDALHEEIKKLQKTRKMSVEEYDAQFHHLLQLERWVPQDDGACMTTEDQCRYFSAGMPLSWQVIVMPQQVQWENLSKLKAHYLACESVEQRPTRNTRKPNSKEKSRCKVKKAKKDKNQREKAESTKKWKLDIRDGCSFCQVKGTVWNNHRDEECFRNPQSLRFRPRAVKKSELKNETSPQTGNRPPVRQHTTATKTAIDDLSANWHTDLEEQGAVRPGSTLRVKMTRNKQTYSLPDTDWEQQEQRTTSQIRNANTRENQEHEVYDYQPEDLVMIVRSDSKLQQLYDGPFRVFSVRSDGILVINKGKYHERIHMRRVKPFKSSTVEQANGGN